MIYFIKIFSENRDLKLRLKKLALGQTNKLTLPGSREGGKIKIPPTPILWFFALYSKSKGETYLKFLEFSQLFAVDAPKKKKIPRI